MCFNVASRRLIVIAITVSVCLFLIGATLEMVQVARESSRRKQSRNRGGDPVEDTKTLLAMRAKFPIVSLDDRLSYEPLVVSFDDSEQILSRESDNAIVEYEKMAKQDLRRWSLGKLHDQSYEQFVATIGFGLGRMWQPLKWETILVPESQLIAWPSQMPDTSIDSQYDAHATAANSVGLDPIAVSDDLSQLHNDHYFDFVNPKRLGVNPFVDHLLTQYSSKPSSDDSWHSSDQGAVGFGSNQSRLSVGFTSHSMTRTHRITPVPKKSVWTIAKLELVSLLKFKEPRIYVSTNFPNMHELKNAPSRPLEEFE